MSPMFDMPLEDLQRYQPDVIEPDDFDSFWRDTLESARKYPLDARFDRTDFKLKTVECYDVTFNGYGGQPIKGWFILPAGTREPLPTVVRFIGYGGGRGWPLDWLAWPSAGYAFLVMDTRGQGSSWRRGDTPDILDGANPSFPGFMTQGILDPQTYYYRRVMCDAVRAVEAARAHPLVDTNRMVIAGGSQGGGLAIAAAALSENIAALIPDVPFLCHIERAINITPDPPYTEIVSYLRVHSDKAEIVRDTLRYFDGVNFAKRIQDARALFSVALMDTICPPSTVFAAYNALKVKKEIVVYPYADHAGGSTDQLMRQIAFLDELF